MIDDRRWHLRKRVVVPALFVALLAAATFVLAARACVVEPVREPESASQGVLVQLVERDGRRVVRCAALLAAPPAKVWGVVTGYERFGQVFPRLEEVHVQREPGGVVVMTGNVRTPVGSLPFATRIKHEEGAVSRATWDEPGGALTVNRGSWTVSPAGGGTKLEYEVDVSVTKFPDIVVRAAVRHLAPHAIQRVIAEVTR